MPPIKNTIAVGAAALFATILVSSTAAAKPTTIAPSAKVGPAAAKEPKAKAKQKKCFNRRKAREGRQGPRRREAAGSGCSRTRCFDQHGRERSPTHVRRQRLGAVREGSEQRRARSRRRQRDHAERRQARNGLRSSRALRVPIRPRREVLVVLRDRRSRRRGRRQRIGRVPDLGGWRQPVLGHTPHRQQRLAEGHRERLRSARASPRRHERRRQHGLRPCRLGLSDALLHGGTGRHPRAGSRPSCSGAGSRFSRSCAGPRAGSRSARACSDARSCAGADGAGDHQQAAGQARRGLELGRTLLSVPIPASATPDPSEDGHWRSSTPRPVRVQLLGRPPGSVPSGARTAGHGSSSTAAGSPPTALARPTSGSSPG